MHEMPPERIPASMPVLSDVNLMKARLDELDNEIGRLNIEKLRLAHHFQWALRKQAELAAPVELQKSTTTTCADDLRGPNRTGFEDSCRLNNTGK
jgi:hypothetical protein